MSKRARAESDGTSVTFTDIVGDMADWTYAELQASRAGRGPNETLFDIGLAGGFDSPTGDGATIRPTGATECRVELVKDTQYTTVVTDNVKAVHARSQSFYNIQVSERN